MAQVLELLDIDDQMFGNGATVYWAGLWRELDNARYDNTATNTAPYVGIVISASASTPHQPSGTTVLTVVYADGETVELVAKANPFTENLTVPTSVDEFGDTFGIAADHWYTLRADGTWKNPTQSGFRTPVDGTPLAYDDADAGDRERIPLDKTRRWSQIILSWRPG